MQLTQIDFDKQQVHLRNVSRTFALTIPMLPKSLIDYISNAYLLCRIADTVEDDPIAADKQKISWLISFADFCKSLIEIFDNSCSIFSFNSIGSSNNFLLHF